MFGLLNLNKPPGWTSRDAVNRVQRIVRPTKVGHAGTLDPLATGVLVVCLGPATRLIEYVQKMSKTYRGTFLLGQSSLSDDVESEVTHHADAPQPTRENIETALPQFLGTIPQRPPAFSAIKVKGRRAYELARHGEAVELKSRPVEIYSLTIERYEYPELDVSLRCGSGTYVRSLGRDLAAALGTHAVMSALTRTAIGAFSLEQAIDPQQLDRETIASSLQSPLLAVAHLPRIVLDDSQLKEISHGREIDAAQGETAEEIAGVNSAGELVALLKSPRPGRLRATRNFA